MLASSGAVPGDPAAWSYEVRWDGWRALVYVGGGVKVRTRTGPPGTPEGVTMHFHTSGTTVVMLRIAGAQP